MMQNEVVSVQTDSVARISVLRFAAAGISVTLIVASTIWFAEMFWTPEFMIESEDRCYQFGQQYPVHC